MYKERAMTNDEQQQDHPATDPGAQQSGAPAPEPPKEDSGSGFGTGCAD